MDQKIKFQIRMIRFLSEPSEKSDVTSEGGYTHVMWTVDGKLIYLYQGYGTVDLQFILPLESVDSRNDDTQTSDFPDKH